MEESFDNKVSGPTDLIDEELGRYLAKPLYVIVHKYLVESDKRDTSEVKAVKAEIERIISDECYILVHDNPNHIPDILKNDFLDEGEYHRSILVCGAYYSGKIGFEKCVDSQLNALLKEGYHASIHFPGTLPFWLGLYTLPYYSL